MHDNHMSTKRNDMRHPTPPPGVGGDVGPVLRAGGPTVTKSRKPSLQSQHNAHGCCQPPLRPKPKKHKRHVRTTYRPPHYNPARARADLLIWMMEHGLMSDPILPDDPLPGLQVKRRRARQVDVVMAYLPPSPAVSSPGVDI